MKTYRNHPFFRVLQNYVTFFLLVAFIVSCCMMLFVSILADSMGLIFTKDMAFSRSYPVWSLVLQGSARMASITLCKH